jgi:exodeoxyribonuclease VII large subunit
MQPIKLSELLADIDDTLQFRFAGETFWITAEITDVKKQPDKRWCFLKLIEKDGRLITTEIRAVFWSNAYYNIEKFEHLTRQTFANGLEITCNVRVRFHQRYGLDLEVLQIDLSYAVGKSELEREQTLARLVAENPSHIKLIDGQYITTNETCTACCNPAHRVGDRVFVRWATGFSDRDYP